MAFVSDENSHMPHDPTITANSESITMLGNRKSSTLLAVLLELPG